LGWDHEGDTEFGWCRDPRISAGFRRRCESCRRTSISGEHPETAEICDKLPIGGPTKSHYVPPPAFGGNRHTEAPNSKPISKCGSRLRACGTAHQPCGRHSLQTPSRRSESKSAPVLANARRRALTVPDKLSRRMTPGTKTTFAKPAFRRDASNLFERPYNPLSAGLTLPQATYFRYNRP
jgi:hypothetical protein